MMVLKIPSQAGGRHSTCDVTRDVVTSRLNRGDSLMNDGALRNCSSKRNGRASLRNVGNGSKNVSVNVN